MLHEIGSIVFLSSFLVYSLRRLARSHSFRYFRAYILTMRFSTLTLAAALSELSIAGYVLEDDYMTDFYKNFDFFTGTDPTNGD